MEITLEIIPKIEQSLKIKLYESQIEALVNDNYSLFNGRRCGRTIVYMIKLALSEGEPLEVHRFGNYTDRDRREIHYNHWFRNEFMKVREILKDNGFKVRDIACNGRII